jgi:hypothetical protein
MANQEHTLQQLNRRLAKQTWPSRITTNLLRSLRDHAESAAPEAPIIPDRARRQSGSFVIHVCPRPSQGNLGEEAHGDQILSCRSCCGAFFWLWPTRRKMERSGSSCRRLPARSASFTHSINSKASSFLPSPNGHESLSGQSLAAFPESASPVALLHLGDPGLRHWDFSLSCRTLGRFKLSLTPIQKANTVLTAILSA